MNEGSGSGVAAIDPPKYEDYSLIELYQVLNYIRSDLYPNVNDALEKELGGRESTSVVELEECYFVLDKDMHPEHAARLLAKINILGGFSLLKKELISGRNRYRNFWRRFWALFLDGLVVGIPLAIILGAIHGAEILGPRLEAYTDRLAEIVLITYYIVMHAAYGQTLGKMATRVKIVDKSEEKGITVKQSVIREIVPLLFAAIAITHLMVFGESYDMTDLSAMPTKILYASTFASLAWGIAELITMLFNRKRRAIHDLLAGTVVIRIA